MLLGAVLGDELHGALDLAVPAGEAEGGDGEADGEKNGGPFLELEGTVLENLELSSGGLLSQPVAIRSARFVDEPGLAGSSA